MLFQGWTGFVDGVFEAKESVAMISIKQAVGQHDSAAVPGSAIYISTLIPFVILSVVRKPAQPVTFCSSEEPSMKNP